MSLCIEERPIEFLDEEIDAPGLDPMRSAASSIDSVVEWWKPLQ